MNCLYIKLILIFVLNICTNIFEINCCFREDNKKIDNNDKNEYKEINIDDILNKLDKNIPDNFINLNKVPVLKMIKVYNKDFKDEDIDIILQVLYNFYIKKVPGGDVLSVIKAKIFKNKNNEGILITIDENDKITPKVYIVCYNTYQYSEFSLSPGINVIKYILFEIKGNYNSISFDDNGHGSISFQKFDKILFDIFYEKNVKNCINFPLDIFYTIKPFFIDFFLKASNLIENEQKKKIEELNKSKKLTFNIKTDTLEEPVYIYLCNDNDECYPVKIETEFKNLASNIDQLIVKISSEKVEIFKK